MNKLKSTKDNITGSELPDGSYNGLWSGYVLDIEHNGHSYELTTQNGNRGLNIPVTVTVKNGIGTFNETTI